MRRLTLLALATSGLFAAAPAQAITFVNALRIDNIVTGANDANRFGGFGSDLVYNARDGLYYGMTDRGPGGGLLSYAPRIQAFSVDVATNGAVANFSARNPIVFTRDGVAFNGQNPALLNGSSATLGRSFDPEGLAIRNNGNFLVSDEYGPSIYEFDSQGRYIRAFDVPANLMPKAGDTPNYVDGRPTITSGRQDNRGFEGLTLSNDGTKAFAILQDPLVNEGPVNNGEAQGRRGQNLRIVEFDVATGQSTKQYAYTLESLASINGRIPGTANDFSANQQGRSIGVSSITQLPDGRFLVIERDNRGWGVDDTVNRLPIGSKRVYLINIDGTTTDISNVSLAGLSGLPAGVTAVTKGSQPFLDIQALLSAAGVPIAEKLEGLSFGPMLADGGRSLFIISDNDFSVTQFDGSSTQFEYCTSGPEANAVSFTPALGTPCPTGTSLIPTFLYSFKLSAAEAGALGFANTPVPEPTTWAMLIAGFGLVGSTLRRRKVRVVYA